MNGTPRVHGAFPLTPKAEGVRRRFPPSQQSPLRTPSKLPSVSILQSSDQSQHENGPLISIDLISPAQQRFSILCVYAALWVWRLWDLWRLIEDDTESLWQFLKWLFIDSVFLFGVPALRIPWLEWSSGTTTLLFCGHALINGMLMFRVAAPFTFFFEALVKFFWDKEQGLSDRTVEPAKLLDTAPFLSGRQVVHLLPEGSVHLNPNNERFCLGEGRRQIHIPIQTNQTEPVLIELLRLDLDTEQTETIVIKASEAKKLRSVALRQLKHHHDPASPLMLHYPMKKTGQFKIQKVLDQSGLAVRPRGGELIVANCPKASIREVEPNKCRGDMSSIMFDLEGVHPLQLKYAKIVDGKVQGTTSLTSSRPEGLAGSASSGEETENAIVKRQSGSSIAKSRRAEVPLNEMMSEPGTYSYLVESIEDALGNLVTFKEELDAQGNPKSKSQDVERLITVHDRPKVSMWSAREKQGGCDSQNPLKVAKGEEINLPIRFQSVSKAATKPPVHTVELAYTPEEEMSNFSFQPEIRTMTFRNPNQPIKAKGSGLYALKSVRTEYCAGEVVEPASCLLQHATEPSVEFNRRDITDRCKAMPIGLILDLEFTGTPPFTLTYLVSKDGEHSTRQGRVRTEQRRYQLELRPESAGRYKYSFTHLSDHHYSNLMQSWEVEQDVKPSASAKFERTNLPQRLCKDEATSARVRFTGEPPYMLSYALTQGGKPRKQEVAGIMDDQYTINTGALTGGDYTLSLLSVTDSRDCPETLAEELKFSVRHSRPKASFGLLDGKKSMQIVEGQQRALPVRLSGEGPWVVTVKNLDDSSGPIRHETKQPNSHISVNRPGTYVIQSVHDACPGDVDESANELSLSWIGRPSIRLSETAGMTKEGNVYRRPDVCEGDGDDFELAFSGTPPFTVKYDAMANPEHGQRSFQRKELPGVLGVASVQLDTEKAGDYEYKFNELHDHHYKHDTKRLDPIIVRQKVNSRPTAKFKTPGKTYNYCTVEGSGSEDIPITFTGQPPFSIELEIKHSGSTKPEILRFSNLQSHSETINIAKRHLIEGHSHLSIRRIKDARGCQSKPLMPGLNNPRVQISVHEPPRLEPIEAAKEDYCVGERVSFRLTGAPPFNIFYTWHGKDRKASSGGTFQRIADEPGVFAITGISDSGSDCRAPISSIIKTIHPIPEAKIAQGRQAYTDIHEGGTADLVFELKGTPPFLFTYTRAELPARKGQTQGAILETKTVETLENRFVVEAGEEGVYEVISVKDRWCGASKQGVQSGRKGQKLLVQG